LRLLLVLLLVGLALGSGIAQAQGGAELLEYGQSVTGELSNQKFEFAYTFTGKAGDVIIIEMAETDSESDLDNPAIFLLDSNSEVIGTAEGAGGRVVFAAELPDAGTYTILATREGGRGGESVGPYRLTLLQPPLLVVGEPVTATADSREVSYFAIRVDGPFALSYVKQGGDFNPEISVNQIEDNELRAVAAVSGKALASSLLRLEPEDGQTVFIVKAARQLFDIILGEATADFSLELQSME